MERLKWMKGQSHTKKTLENYPTTGAKSHNTVNATFPQRCKDQYWAKGLQQLY